MQKRKLGWTELEFTTIGLGTWALGGGNWAFGWGLQDDRKSIRTIHRALDLGINWIDTAPVYGLGHSEEVIGRAFKGLTSIPLIATKCGRIWDEGGHIYGSLRAKSIRREVEKSFKRLKVEIIDLFQLHWPDPEEEIEEAWDTVARLIEEGKVRYGGVSNFNVEQMKRLQSIHPIGSLQPPYSLLRREIEDEIIEFCQKNRIGLIVYSPLQKGLLTGKITKERIAQFPMDDHRRKDPRFLEPEISRIIEFVNRLKPIAENFGITLAQLAIAWVLKQPAVTSAIVGARKVSQIEETIDAGNWEFKEGEFEIINALIQEMEEDS